MEIETRTLTDEEIETVVPGAQAGSGPKAETRDLADPGTEDTDGVDSKDTQDAQDADETDTQDADGTDTTDSTDRNGSWPRRGRSGPSSIRALTPKASPTCSRSTTSTPWCRRCRFGSRPSG